MGKKKEQVMGIEFRNHLQNTDKKEVFNTSAPYRTENVPAPDRRYRLSLT